MAEKLAPVTEVMFNITSEPYQTFVDRLRVALAGVNPREKVGPPPNSKVERPVMDEQKAPDKQPPRWIRVVLNAGNGAKDPKPKVAIRSDDAYILGFSNSKGEWFQLSKTGTKYNLVNDKNVKMLGFEGNYNDLLGQSGINGLKALNLSKDSMSTVATTLWNHTDAKLDDDDDDMLRKGNDYLKKPIARLCVVLSEAARFIPVSNVISNGWSTNSKEVFIRDNEVKYMKEWGDLSSSLLQWKDAAYKGDKKLFEDKFGKTIGIKNGEQALAVVRLVKRIRRKSLFAWLKYFLGLLVKKLQQEDTTVYENPKSSAVVSPL